MVVVTELPHRLVDDSSAVQQLRLSHVLPISVVHGRPHSIELAHTNLLIVLIISKLLTYL